MGLASIVEEDYECPEGSCEYHKVETIILDGREQLKLDLCNCSEFKKYSDLKVLGDTFYNLCRRSLKDVKLE